MRIGGKCMTRKCKTCGEELDPQMNFCPNCGQPSGVIEDKQAIDKAMRELNTEIKSTGKEVPEKEESNSRKSMILLIVLTLILVGVLGGLLVKMVRNEEKPVQPNEPVVDVPKEPADSDVNEPNSSEISNGKPTDQNDEDETNRLAHTAHIEAFKDTFLVDHVEVKPQDETLRFEIYYQTTVPLSITLVDDTGRMQIGPIDLGASGEYAYFELNRSSFAANQLMFLFNQSDDPTIAGEVIIEKSEFEKYLKPNA